VVVRSWLYTRSREAAVRSGVPAAGHFKRRIIPSSACAGSLGPPVLEIATELPPSTPTAEAIALGELIAPLLGGLEELAAVPGALAVGPQPSTAPSGALIAHCNAEVCLVAPAAGLVDVDSCGARCIYGPGLITHRR